MKRSLSWPWVTTVAVISAWVAALIPAAAASLLLDRQAVGGGEFWRLWTGHWVHFSWSHLFLDTVVLGVAGSMVERTDPGRWILFLVATPCIISACLLVFLPHLELYGGLSGLATGAVVLWIMDLQGRSMSWKIAGWVILSLIGLKILAEYLHGSPFFADLSETGVRSVPLSHLAGGFLGWLVGWTPKQTSNQAMAAPYHSRQEPGPFEG